MRRSTVVPGRTSRGSSPRTRRSTTLDERRPAPRWRAAARVDAVRGGRAGPRRVRHGQRRDVRRRQRAGRAVERPRPARRGRPTSVLGPGRGVRLLGDAHRALGRSAGGGRGAVDGRARSRRPPRCRRSPRARGPGSWPEQVGRHPACGPRSARPTALVDELIRTAPLVVDPRHRSCEVAAADDRATTACRARSSSSATAATGWSPTRCCGNACSSRACPGSAPVREVMTSSAPTVVLGDRPPRP